MTLAQPNTCYNPPPRKYVTTSFEFVNARYMAQITHLVYQVEWERKVRVMPNEVFPMESVLSSLAALEW